MEYKNNPYVIALTIVLTAIIVGGGVYFWQETEQTKSTQAIPAKTETTKDYNDDKSGLSFKYPDAWSFAGNYVSENAPGLFVDIFDINKMSTVCGDLGGCQQDAKKLQAAIDKGTATEIISFQGGKGSLTVSCSGNEGYDGVPSPMYEFNFFKGSNSYLLRLNDLSHRLDKKETCPQMIAKAEGKDYKPYNDFVSLIKNTLVLK